jgi:hypothetical protein
MNLKTQLTRSSKNTVKYEGFQELPAGPEAAFWGVSADMLTPQNAGVYYGNFQKAKHQHSNLSKRLENGKQVSQQVKEQS